MEETETEAVPDRAAQVVTAEDHTGTEATAEVQAAADELKAPRSWWKS